MKKEEEEEGIEVERRKLLFRFTMKNLRNNKLRIVIINRQIKYYRIKFIAHNYGGIKMCPKKFSFD